MGKNLNYNYAFVMYDVKEKRVSKVFKLCKKYFSHFQNSVFRGDITSSDLLKFRNELNKIINVEEDTVCIIKLINSNSYAEEVLGVDKINGEDLIF